MTYSIEKLVYHLRGLYSAPIICELSKRKIFKFIKNKAIFDKKKLTSIKSKKELEACLSYLIRINLLNKLDNNELEFTEMGAEIFKRANSYYVPHSYRDYILNLGNIFDKKIDIKKLKVDRNENIIGSGLTHMRYFPPVISYLSQNNSYHAGIDVGCGNGHFLNLVNENFQNLDLYGFDVSSTSVKSAKLIKKKNRNNIKIFKADASKINQWKKKINIKGKKTIFFFWFLLHEISKNKKSIIIDYLKSIKKNFPNSTIVICELTKQKDIILQENCEKSLMPEYLLFHDFSGQGVLGFSDYKEILKKSGYSLKKEWMFDQSPPNRDINSEPSTFVWVLE